MAELNFMVRWQATGEDKRDGHVGEPYPGNRQKYRYRYFITGNGKLPRRWVAYHRANIIDRFETLTEAKDACQKDWESRPECPKLKKFKAVGKSVEKMEVKFKKVGPGYYGTQDERFSIQRKKFVNTWWLITDAFGKLPKGLSETDTLAEAKEIIVEFLNEEELYVACERCGGQYIPDHQAQICCPKCQRTGNETQFKAVSKTVEKNEVAGMSHAAERIPCENHMPLPSGANGDLEKKHAIVKVNEAIRKLNSIEWSHRNLQINDIDLAKDKAFKGLESLRHVLQFYNGL